MSAAAERGIEDATLRARLLTITADDFGGDRYAATLAWAADVAEAEASRWPEATHTRMAHLEQAATFWTAYVFRISEIDPEVWDDEHPTRAFTSERKRLSIVKDANA